MTSTHPTQWISLLQVIAKLKIEEVREIAYHVPYYIRNNSAALKFYKDAQSYSAAAQRLLAKLKFEDEFRPNDSAGTQWELIGLTAAGIDQSPQALNAEIRFFVETIITWPSRIEESWSNPSLPDSIAMFLSDKDRQRCSMICLEQTRARQLVLHIADRWENQIRLDESWSSEFAVLPGALSSASQDAHNPIDYDLSANSAKSSDTPNTSTIAGASLVEQPPTAATGPASSQSDSSDLAIQPTRRRRQIPSASTDYILQQSAVFLAEAGMTLDFVEQAKLVIRHLEEVAQDRSYLGMEAGNFKFVGTLKAVKRSEVRRRIKEQQEQIRERASDIRAGTTKNRILDR